MKIWRITIIIKWTRHTWTCCTLHQTIVIHHEWWYMPQMLCFFASSSSNVVLSQQGEFSMLLIVGVLWQHRCQFNWLYKFVAFQCWDFSCLSSCEKIFINSSVKLLPKVDVIVIQWTYILSIFLFFLGCIKYVNMIRDSLNGQKVSMLQLRISV